MLDNVQGMINPMSASNDFIALTFSYPAVQYWLSDQRLLKFNLYPDMFLSL